MTTTKLRQAGFTLLEIVISLGIFGVLMLVGYNSLRSIIQAKEILDDSRDSRAVADAILSRITRELQLAVVGLPIIPPPDQISQPNSPRINLIGEDSEVTTGVPGNSITFLALEGGQYLPDGGSHAGIVQISYKVARDPDAARGQEETFLLVRQELPYVRPYKRAYDKVMNFPLARNIVSLRFWYLDQETPTWVTTWGTDKRLNIPRLVKFSLQLRSPRGQVETYTTVVPLRAKA